MNPPSAAQAATPAVAARGAERLARVGALGGSSMLLAVGAHLMGGGGLPPAVLLWVLGGLVGLAAVTVTARRLRFGSLAAVLAVQQLALHYLLRAGTGLRGGCSAMPALHSAHLATHGIACTSLPGSASGGAPMSMPGWPMLVAHLIATLLTAWLLARGESWWWRVADRAIRSAAAEPTPGPSAVHGVRTDSTDPCGPGAPPRSDAVPRAPPVRLVLA
jgi:hypothetical protein